MNPDQPQPPPTGPLRGEVTMTIGAAIGIGRSLHRRGLLLEAESVYRQILTRKPGQPEALHFLGVVLHQMGRRDEAASFLLAALEADPVYVDALNNLGNVLREMDRHGPAEAAYRRAIELKPEFAEAHINLAALLFEREQFEEAVSESRRAMELAPQLSGAHEVAGGALSIRGRPADTTEEDLQTQNIKLFHAAVHENMALALMRLGRTPEAADIYRRWSCLDPDDPRPRHHLAACTGTDVPLRASDDYVLEVFDRFAATFDERLQSLEYAAPGLVVEAVEAELGPPQARLAVLDAGCGTGLCGAGIRPYAQRLTGVDLSPRMLAKARECGVYDELCEAELTGFMLRSRGAYDLIISADTLTYFGSLAPVVAAAAAALRPGGRFVFTLEKADPAQAPGGFRLESHGRYIHTQDHVRRAIELAGFETGPMREVFLRMEGRLRVIGWLTVARVPGRGPAEPCVAERRETVPAGERPSD